MSTIRPAKPGSDDSDVLDFAALASSPEGQDPIDSVIRTTVAKGRGRASLTVVRFTPFDPAVKMAEAIAVEAGHEIRVVKGAPAIVAKVGIAVSTATDVAKAAAGVVLTEPGLGGIVACIKEGRSAFQRVLTYTLTILINKCVTLIVRR